MKQYNLYKAAITLVIIIIFVLSITSCGLILSGVLDEITEYGGEIKTFFDQDNEPVLESSTSPSNTESIASIKEQVGIAADTTIEPADTIIGTIEVTTIKNVETTAPVVTPPIVDANIELLSLTSPVSRNNTATIKIKGKPDTEYKITVRYKSGSSKAEGLEAKTSDSDGYVWWSWDIGPRTSAGTFMITIIGGGETFETPFTVSD